MPVGGAAAAHPTDRAHCSFTNAIRSRHYGCVVLLQGSDAECDVQEWPYLKSIFVPAWQLAVYSYRKAEDDHIKILDLSQGAAVPLEQAEYDNRIGVPTGVDDSDNFVTGLALDYSHKVGRGVGWGQVGGGGDGRCQARAVASHIHASGS